MDTHPVFLVERVPTVSEWRRRELVADLQKVATLAATVLVARFGEKPEEFAAVLSEAIVISDDLSLRQRLRKLREWWEFSERRKSLGFPASGIENTIDFFDPHAAFVPVRERYDPSCLARSLVQRLMEGPNPGVRFDAGRELLIKMLLIRTHQCGVFAE